MKHIANYYSDWKEDPLNCEKCNWSGMGGEAEQGELFKELFEMDCPECGEVVAIVSLPTIEETRDNLDKLPEEEKEQFLAVQKHWASWENEKLTSPAQLPDIPDEKFTLLWDFLYQEGYGSRTLIKLSEQEIHSEPVIYEGYKRFIEVARILKEKYGDRIQDLEPSEGSYTYLYGDKLTSPEQVDEARREIFGNSAGDE